MAVRVTLLVYSGRENPSWTLSDEQSAELGHLLAASQRAEAAPDALGYRGFLIEPETGPRLHVYRATGGLERWLLGTAGRAVSDDVRRHVESRLAG